MSVAFDANATAPATANTVTTIDLTTLTVGSGSNRALVVQLAFDGAAPGSLTVTWDQGGTNQACTLIKSQASGGTVGTAQLWGLVAPTSGNKTLRVSWSGNKYVIVNALAFTGADQTGSTTTFPHSTSATGNSTAPSIAITSATGNYTVEAGASAPAFVIPSSPSQTQTHAATTGGKSGWGSRAAGAASNTHSWTLSSSWDWAEVGTDIAASVSVTTVALTGVAATGSVGTIIPGEAVSGVSSTGSCGSVVAAVVLALTGLAGTGSVGSVTPVVNPVQVDIHDHAETTGTSLTKSLTLGSSANLLVVGVAMRDGGATYTPATLKWNGVDLTNFDNLGLVDGVPAGHGDYKLYYLVNPDTGTHNLVATANSSQYIVLNAVSFVNAAGQVPSPRCVSTVQTNTTTYTVADPAGRARDLQILFLSDIDVASQSVTSLSGAGVQLLEDHQQGGSTGVHAALAVGAGIGGGNYSYVVAASVPGTINFYAYIIAAPIVPTGVLATGSVGSVVASISDALTGVAATGAVGTVGIVEALTGVAAAGSVGTLVPGDSDAITGEAATSDVGTMAALEADVAITGESTIGDVGTAAAEIEVAVAGLAATGDVGSVSPNAPVIVPITGEAATGDVGTVAPEADFALSGIAAAGAPGALASGTTVASSGVAATGATGSVGVGEGLVGVDATVTPGSVAPQAAVALVGRSATGSVGAESPSTSVALTGASATGAVGTVEASEAGLAGLVGQAAAGAVGSVAPSSAVAASGTAATGSPGSVLATQAISGVSSVAAVGSVAPGERVLALSGVAATAAVGSVVEGESEALTGVSAVGSVGSVLPVLVGSRADGSTGDVQAGVDVPITGTVATGAVGTVGTAFGQPVVWRIFEPAREETFRQATRQLAFKSPARDLTLHRAAARLSFSQPARRLVFASPARHLILTRTVG